MLSSGQATLVCVTGATASPEADSGTLTTLRVAVLDAAGGEVSSASLADSYMLRPLSELPTLTGWPYPYPYPYPTPNRTLPVPYPYPTRTLPIPLQGSIAPRDQQRVGCKSVLAALASSRRVRCQRPQWVRPRALSTPRRAL